MKKIFISIIFISILAPQSIATSSIRTFTPMTPSYNYSYHKHPPTRFSKHYKKQNKHNCPYHNNYNNRYYNNYYPNHPYYNGYNNTYYPQKSFFSSIKDFFGNGQVTGYTPSFNSSFDNVPYGYHSGIYDPNGNFYGGDYNFSSGATIKILD